MHELLIYGYPTDFEIYKAITVVFCPYLKKLCIKSESYAMSESNFLQSIANNYPQLQCLAIIHFYYNTSAECDADVTAFAEKCPQLEELCLDCGQLTDQSVIALARHCSRLKMLALKHSEITVASLIALSERGLPLEHLEIPWIPIPSAEIAAQCAHALSRIPELSRYNYNGRSNDAIYAIEYMAGLRMLDLWSSEDHLLVPHLLLHAHCAGLESLYIHRSSSITLQQLSELVTACSKLRTLCTDKIYPDLLVELARSCPHLQKVTLCIPAVR